MLKNFIFLFYCCILITTQSNAQSKNALLFNGTSQYVTCGNRADMTFGGSAVYTMEAWIKVAGNGTRTILSKYDAGVEGTYYFAINASNKLIMYREVSPFNVVSNLTIEYDLYTHVAATYDGTNVRLYINGVLDNTVSIGATAVSPNTQVLIGASYSGGSPTNFFDGEIDEIKVWNSVRTNSQIAANAHKEISASLSGLVAYYKFNDGTGTTLTEIKNGPNGTLVNSPSWVASGANIAESNPGNGLHFDGIDDYIFVGSKPLLNMETTSFTIQASVYPTGNGSDGFYGGSILFKDNEYTIGRFADGKLQVAISNTSPGWNWVNTGLDLPLNTWTDFTIVYDRSLNKIFAYTNGVSQTFETAGTGNVNVAFTNFLIGGRSSVQFFDGIIDELRVWRTARTPNEIANTAKGPIDPQSAGLVAYYRFDEGISSGNNAGVNKILDLSSSGYSGIQNFMALSGSTSNFVKSTQYNSWKGGTSTDWTNTSNWGLGSVPVSTEEVVIPGDADFQPTVSGSPSIKGLSIEQGATLTLGSNLNVSGNLLNKSSILGSSILNINGSSAQHIFGVGSVSNLTINNSTGVTINDSTKITGALTLTNGLLTTNSKLSLNSTSTTNSRIAQITGGSISGSVTLERYIPSGKRAYRQLASGVNSTANIRTNWQENGGNAVGKGIYITGSIPGENGFDATGSGAASMYTYNSGASNFTAIPNTSATNLKALKGYRVFIIGDRNADLAVINNTGTGTPNIALNNPTTIRSTGTIVTGTVTYNKDGATANGSTDNSITMSTATDDFSLLANPYWSPVDFDLVELASSNIAKVYWIWDPAIGNRGAYVSYSTISGSSGGAITKDIQPGQSFFVQTKGATPSVVFEEAHKSSGFTNTFRAATSTPSKLRIQLFNNSALANNGNMQDGATVAFRDDFNAAVGVEDAAKFTNTDENLAIVRGTQVLGIEGRPTVTAADTIPLRIWKLYSNNQYTLKLDGLDFDAGITGVLVDKFLNQQTILNTNGSITYPFAFSTSDSATFYNRFMLVFRPSAPLPINFTSVKAMKKNAGIQVDWSLSVENNMKQYEIEKSTDGRIFNKAATQLATSNNSREVGYSWYDANPVSGTNYYRIRAVGATGEVSYTTIVKVNLNGEITIVSLYPNPVKGNNFSLQLEGLDAGTYSIQMFNNIGQQVYSKSIATEGGNLSQSILLNQMSAGIYTLVVLGNQGIISSQKVIKE